MPFDKFINSMRAVAAKKFDLKTDDEIDAFFLGIEESAKDNQQAIEKRDKMLRDTVAELCEAKRLLKMAVDDMNNGGCNSNCYKCKHCGACDYSERFTWKLTDEALKLIGGETDEKP